MTPHEEDPIPLVGNIELTNRCNLRCAMCANRLMTRRRGDMPLDVLELVLRKLARAGTQQVILNTIGETLLYPHLEEALRAAKRHGFYVLVSTNGQRLDEATARALLAGGCDVLRLSIEGVDAGTYEAARAGASFGALLANVARLRPLRDACGSSTVLRIRSVVASGATERDRLRFAEFWGPRVDEIEFIAFGNMGGQIGGAHDADERRAPCATMWRGVNVLYDGRVTRCPCDFDARFVVGSLIESELAEVWNGAAYREARRLHRALDFATMPACDACSATRKAWYEQKVPRLTEEERRIMGLYRTEPWS